MTSAPMPFTLEAQAGWLGRFSGRAIDDSPSGLPGVGQVQGKVRWGSIQFSWLPSLPYQIEPDAFRPLPETAGSQPLPVHFAGRISRSGQTASGEWRIMTWMMQSETRRKMQVIIAHGTWHATRQG